MFNYTLDGNRDLMNSSRISGHLEALSILNKLPMCHEYVCTPSHVPVCWFRAAWFRGVCNYRALKQRDVTIRPLTRVKTNGTVIIYYKYNLKNILFFSRLSVYPGNKKKKGIIICNIAICVAELYNLVYNPTSFLLRVLLQIIFT